MMHATRLPLDGYRDFYVEHFWERTQFYDGLARRVLNRPVRHALLNAGREAAQTSNIRSA